MSKEILQTPIAELVVSIDNADGDDIIFKMDDDEELTSGLSGLSLEQRKAFCEKKPWWDSNPLCVLDEKTGMQKAAPTSKQKETYYQKWLRVYAPIYKPMMGPPNLKEVGQVRSQSKDKNAFIPRKRSTQRTMGDFFKPKSSS